jgi:hypothetical protein
VDSVDSGDKILVGHVVACPHVSTVNNPLLSLTPNVAIKSSGTVYMIVEEGKIKLVCNSCLTRSLGLSA